MKGIKKYYILVSTTFLFSLKIISQPYQFKIWSGNLGGAIYKQDFGFGDSNINIAGPALRP